jgi:hypothetical protein
VAVVVNVSLSLMLVFGVLVWYVGVRKRSVIVFVQVQRGEMLPFPHDLVWSLSAIVCHMRMVVVVHDGIVAVLDELSDVGPLTNLVEGTPSLKRQKAQKAHETDGCSSCGRFFHSIPLLLAALVSRLSECSLTRSQRVLLPRLYLQWQLGAIGLGELPLFRPSDALPEPR